VPTSKPTDSNRKVTIYLPTFNSPFSQLNTPSVADILIAAVAVTSS
jgi:hypothetical protein